MQVQSPKVQVSSSRCNRLEKSKLLERCLELEHVGVGKDAGKLRKTEEQIP